jgi:hypothetical protein
MVKTKKEIKTHSESFNSFFLLLHKKWKRKPFIGLKIIESRIEDGRKRKN